jgi:hypothetical protein
VAVGIVISGTTYVPARVVGEAIGVKIGYVNGKVTANGKPITTQLISDMGYSPIRELVDESDLFIQNVTSLRIDIG